MKAACVRLLFALIALPATVHAAAGYVAVPIASIAPL